jgi:hypothetical protein
VHQRRFTGSDLRLKENIRVLENATAALCLLRGVLRLAQRRPLRRPDRPGSRGRPARRRRRRPRRLEGHQPGGVIALLVEAVKEQQAMIDELRAALPAHPEETHHGRPPRPYVKRTAGDIIRADDWNEVQVRAREDIAAHDHTGGFGAPLPRDGIQNKAIDGSKLDPDSRYTVKELTVAALKVTGTAQLAEIRAALASFSGAKLTTTGDVGVGTAPPPGSR